MDLKSISQVLTAQMPADGEPKTRKESQRRQAMKWGFITFWGGIMLAALFAIMGDAFIPLSHRLGIFIGNLAPLGGLVVTLGIGIMIYSLFLPKAQTGQAEPAKPKPAKSKLRTQPPAQISSEPYRQPVVSVTESTTRLFEQSDSGPSMRDSARQRE
ncbi:MAG TPA: hypothetical protein VJZ26_05880 [Blastocatellia bacterium]|nr:hypothetical protein [Blastocatellia bacterium]